MSLLVCSFLSLIPFPFRHHHISRKSENIPFWSFFKKVPNAALYTWRSYTWRSQMWRPARKRMNDRKKQIHSRNNESFHRAILGCKEGCFKFPSGVYFLQLPIYLYKCHSILPAQGNKQQRQKASHWLDWNYGAMDSSHCYNQYGWYCLQDGVKLQLLSNFAKQQGLQVYTAVQICLVALMCLNANSIPDWMCMGVHGGWFQQRRKY